MSYFNLPVYEIEIARNTRSKFLITPVALLLLLVHTALNINKVFQNIVLGFFDLK